MFSASDSCSRPATLTVRASSFLLATVFAAPVLAQDHAKAVPVRDSARPSAPQVYVAGAVKRPGGYDAGQGLARITISQALALAGRLTTGAKPRSAEIIRRSADGTRFEIPVELDQVLQHDAADLTLRAGDILFVPDSRKPPRRMGPWDPPSTLPSGLPSETSRLRAKESAEAWPVPA